MNRPEVRTESLGGSPLSVAARAGRAPDWYAALPRDARGWRSHARDVAGDVGSDWLDALSPAFAASGAAAQRLAQSAKGQGIVVTTGQQPGLFGGPLMTLAKAITARAIADVLRDATGIPVAPVFWAATDDADFAETAGVWVATDDGADELRLTHKPPVGTPMALAPLDDAIRPLAQRLRAASGSAPHSSYLEAATRAYSREGNTIGGAYVDVLRELLEPLEIAVLDASHEAVIARARGILVQAAQSAETLALAVHARSEAIRAAGFHPQVEEVAGLSLVSITENGKKRRLPIREAASSVASDARASIALTRTSLSDGSAASGGRTRDPADRHVHRRTGRDRVLRAGERGRRVAARRRPARRAALVDHDHRAAHSKVPRRAPALGRGPRRSRTRPRPGSRTNARPRASTRRFSSCAPTWPARSRRCGRPTATCCRPARSTGRGAASSIASSVSSGECSPE